MKRSDWWPLAALGFLLLLTGDLAAFEHAVPAAQPQAKALQEDAWGRTASGIRYITPAGWFTEEGGAAIVMKTPAEDARIAIVDVGIDVEAGTADQAAALAWKRYQPAFEPKVRGSRDRPLRNGWALVRTYNYESVDDANRILRAQVLHEGHTWIVVIMDFPTEAMDRREAQVTRVLSSIRAKTYVPETLAGKTARDLDAQRMAALVQFLEEARTSLAIPGLALGVVQNGEVRYTGGLGIRKVGSDETVDASTRFLTASVTKPLTSLLLAKLVDMGRLDWDDPASRWLSSFKVGDAALTRRIRVRNLLCACAGIPPQDMETIFSGEEMRPEDALRVLERVEPTAAIGELYQYSNLMAVAGGYLGGHVAHGDLPLGTAYDRAMQELVFHPLGMRSTTFDFDVAQAGNFASPHGTTIDGVTNLASMGFNLMSIPTRPDGGAWSNVNDLTRYLQMELTSGLLPDGDRYIGAQALQERLKGQVARGGVDQWYGMGLKTDRTLGITQVMHGGSMAGYQAEIFWLPENNAGYVLLMNADAGMHLRGVFSDRFLEILFDVERGATATLKALPRRLKGEQAEHRAQLLVPLRTKILDRLAPVYSHPTLGTIRVISRGVETWFDFGGWSTEMAQSSSVEGTVLESISPGVAGFRFTLSESEGVRTLILHDGRNTYTFLEGDRTSSVAHVLDTPIASKSQERLLIGKKGQGLGAGRAPSAIVAPYKLYSPIESTRPGAG